MGASPARLTVFSNSKPLSKTIRLVDGKLVKETAARMTDGFFQTCEIPEIEGLPRLFQTLRPNQATGYGVSEFLSGRITVVGNESPMEGLLARTERNFSYQPTTSVMFDDLDVYGEPAFVDAILIGVCPWIAPVRRFYLPSAGASIYLGDQSLNGPTGSHLYFLVDDGTQIPSLGDTIFASLVDAGYGSIKIGQAGQLLLRTLIDDSVYQGNRLDFSGGPVLQDGLTQRSEPVWFGSHPVLVTANVQPRCIDKDHWRKSSLTVRALKREAEADAEKARAHWVDERVKADPAGEASRPRYEQVSGGDNALPPEFVLYTSDDVPVTVGEVLRDRAVWDGRVMRHPLEPIYDCTKLFLLKQGSFPMLSTRAHGGQSWRLLENVADVMGEAPIASAWTAPEQRPATLDAIIVAIENANRDTAEGRQALTEDIPRLAAMAGLEVNKLDLIAEEIRRKLGVKKAPILAAMLKMRPPAAIDPIVDAINRLNQQYAWLSQPCGYFRIAHRDVIGRADFLNHLENDRIWLADAEKWTPAAQAWCESPLRRTHRNVVLDPAQGDVTADGDVNMFAGWGFTPAPGDITPFLDLVAHVYPSPVERLYVLQWLGAPLRFPGLKLTYSLLTWSDLHGVGKSMIFNFVRQLYGSHGRMISNEDILSDYNGWAMGALFVEADEVEIDGKYMSKIKNLITGSVLNINPKFGKAVAQPNKMNIAFSSNKPDAVKLSNGDRRFMVVHAAEVARETAFYQRCIEWWGQGGAQALLHHFLSVQSYEGFEPKGRAPMTEAKTEMIQAGMSDVEIFVKELPQIVHLASALRLQFKQAFDKSISARAIGSAMKRGGYICREIYHENKAQTFYAPIDWASKDNAEWKEVISANGFPKIKAVS